MTKHYSVGTEKYNPRYFQSSSEHVAVECVTSIPPQRHQSPCLRIQTLEAITDEFPRQVYVAVKLSTVLHNIHRRIVTNPQVIQHICHTFWQISS